MFTGIIEDVGVVDRVVPTGGASKLWIGTSLETKTFVVGESVAVDGLCLTVVEIGSGVFRADVSGESLSRSTLKDAKPGRKVNLERAMRADGRFGGHMVSGHIDGVGVVGESRKTGEFLKLQIDANAEILRYVVEKGSVAVDGISLTVNEVSDSSFSMTIIPATIEKTSLSLKKTGDKVNVENDVIGKYVEKFLGAAQKPGITMEKLVREGFGKK